MSSYRLQASLAGLKKLNPYVVTIAYLHSDIMHSWYRAAGRLAKAPECWLRDRSGNIMHSASGRGGGNSGSPTWLIYDHTQPQCSSLWAESCLDLTRSEPCPLPNVYHMQVADTRSCNATHRHHGSSNPNPPSPACCVCMCACVCVCVFACVMCMRRAHSTGVFDACFVDGCTDKPPSGLSRERGIAFVHGKKTMLQALQANVSGALICGSTGGMQLGLEGVQAEGWGVSRNGKTMFAEREIPNLMAAMRAGRLFQAHGRAVCEHGGDPHHPAVQTELAAFLIGMGPQAFYLCGAWEECSTDPPLGPARCAPSNTDVPWFPVYDMPLGAPLANATKTGGVWRRSFASGTAVTFDTAHNSGTIRWANATHS